jgi:hypothetical protein
LGCGWGAATKELGFGEEKADTAAVKLTGTVKGLWIGDVAASESLCG